MTTNTQSWQTRALSIIATKLHDERSRVTGEEVRQWLRTKRLHEPSHPNAYGLLIRRAIEYGYLRPTSKLVPSRTKTSHARARRDYTVAQPLPIVW